jgi:hypothetical protein
MLPFIYFIKDEVMDKVPKQPTTPIEHTKSKHTTHQTQCKLTSFILLLMVAPRECGIQWRGDCPWETPHSSPIL